MPLSTSSLATACVALALVLSGCADDEANQSNNATSETQSCSGKCDSTDPGAGFRPLVGLTLVDGASSTDPSGGDTSDAGDASDAGYADAGYADTGYADAGYADAGYADAGAADTGDASDAGSSDAGSSAPVAQTFRLVAAVGDDHLDQIEADQVLAAKIWTTFGESTSEEPVLAELSYDSDRKTFGSEVIDDAAFADWDVLTVRVSGDIGDEAFEQIFEFRAGDTAGTEIIPDPFADARDVDLAVIELDPELDAPDYPYPSTDAPFALSGTEFWQKWPGGHNPTYSYTEGSQAGQKCMSASAIRFEAVMANPPEALVELEANSNWSGRFFNWNDDFSHDDSTGSPNGAVLWAWRTSLIKWISQTGDDGRCYLPTRGLVERAAANCLQHAEQNDGEIEGCQAY